MLDSAETKRARMLARWAFVWAAIIVARLFFLQVISHKDLKQQAERQQQLEEKVLPPRAAILDREGRPLAKSVDVDSVCVNPLRIPDPDVASEILAKILNVDQAELRGRILNAAETHRGFLWVKRKIDRTESERLRSLNLDWIEFRKETKRYYPNNELAAHAVGTVDFAEAGSSGIEQSLNSDLQGKAGSVRMVTDVHRRPFDSEMESIPVPGADVTLTIDSQVQYVGERELAAAAVKSHARSGSLVVMNAKTGEVLAFANYPTFNPNQLPDPSTSLASRNNVGITSPYEPGSVFKVVTLSCALETTSLRPSSMINCANGALRIGSRVIHEAHHGYGMLSFADVLAKSSNLGAIQIATVAGQQNLYEYVRRFGFGQQTGISLPSESKGRLFKFERWGKTSYASVAMGHEVSVTAMQLAQACSIIANNGALIRPRLVLKKQRPGLPPEFVPAAKPVQVIRPETAIIMRQLMEGVVLHGTGKAAKLKGYTSGGKTGTAQIFDAHTRTYTHNYNGSFIGFAPVANPAIVVVVTLNGTSGGSSGYGGAVAAPVFREVATAALRILNVPKDLPDDDQVIDNEPVDVDDLSIAGLDPAAGSELVSLNPPDLAQGDAPQGQALFVGPTVASNVALGPRVPNFMGKSMREVIQQANAAGLTVEFTGAGVARAQAPLPGQFAPAGEPVRIQFAR